MSSPILHRQSLQGSSLFEQNLQKYKENLHQQGLILVEENM
jgi:hypothetical protein